MACRTADARSFLTLCRAAGTRGVARTLSKVRFIVQIVSGGVDTSLLGLISLGGGGGGGGGGCGWLFIVILGVANVLPLIFLLLCL